MDWNTVWFILIAVLFIGFFFLEGFDYGVGILLPFLGKDDEERRFIINTVGPFWDGNEVWMITAGGAMFAAFPHWYATLFSGFYLALALLLLALIARGVAFEFRSQVEDPKWRNLWDKAIFWGSLLPALLWGVAMSNILRGVPVDETMTYVGGFFNLLNPYALLGGITFVLVFTLHGALFLSLKLAGEMADRAAAMAEKVWPFAVGAFALFAIATIFVLGDAPNKVPAVVIAVLALLAIAASKLFIQKEAMGKAFISVAVGIALTTVALFVGLFPRVLVSSLDPAYSLTIYTASASQYTLKTMTIVAAILVPIVLVYQGWTYWIFRQRIGKKSKLTY
jgi:cytochrome d ubiquinol oxidase subunit II